MLTSKGWVYYSAKKGDTNNYTTIIWSYGMGYDNTAEAWFYHYTDKSNTYFSKVNYTFIDKKIFDKIKQQVVATKKFYKYGDDIDDGLITTTYFNKAYNITFSIHTNNDPSVSHIFRYDKDPVNMGSNHETAIRKLWTFSDNTPSILLLQGNFSYRLFS